MFGFTKYDKIQAKLQVMDFTLFLKILKISLNLHPLDTCFHSIPSLFLSYPSISSLLSRFSLYVQADLAYLS